MISVQSTFKNTILDGDYNIGGDKSGLLVFDEIEFDPQAALHNLPQFK